MLKNLFKIIFIFVIGMIGGIFADQILWPYFIERPLFYQYRLERNPIFLTETKEVFIQENAALKNAIEKVEKVVIGVRTKTKKGKTFWGSGLILTSDGLAITLADLVPEGENSSFFVDGKFTAFQTLKRDSKENLVLIKLESTNLPTVGFFDFGKLKLGERVFLAGIVFENGKMKKVVDEGIVKSFDENLVETNILEKTRISGSPLFDIEGNVLGLNTIDKEGRVVAISIPKLRQFAGL